MEKENLNKQNEVSTETNQQSGSAINAPLFQLQANNQINLPPQLKQDEDSIENSQESLSTHKYDTGDASPPGDKNNPNQLSQAQPPVFQLKSSSASGMPDETLNKMSSSFGTDFSDVNIHSDSKSATDAGALAYTQGNDIHFAPGQYDPSSQSGQELLGHELTHVQQQREGRVQANNEVNGMPLNDDKGLEKEADDMGAKAAQRKSNPNENPEIRSDTYMIPSNAIQRWEWPWHTGKDMSADSGAATEKGKDLKKVKGNATIIGDTGQSGNGFASDIKINGPAPAVGRMNTWMNIKINFQDCTYDFLSGSETRADGSKEKHVLSTDGDSLKTWKKAIEKLQKTSPEKLKWSAVEKEKVKKDYQSDIDKVWPTKSSKLSFKLDNPEYEKYNVENDFELKFVDKGEHHKFTVVKMPDELGPDRIRSYMGGALGGMHDSRTFGSTQNNGTSHNYMAEQIGEFDNNSSIATPAMITQIDKMVTQINKIKEDHKGETPTPTWQISVTGRTNSTGSASLNQRLALKRAATVNKEFENRLGKGIAFAQAGTGKTDASSKFRRVEVVFRNTTGAALNQHTMAHETGHLMGYGDEYSDVGTEGTLPKYEGDEANRTSKHIRDAGLGEDTVKQHGVENNSESIMNRGNTVGVGHYSLFLTRLKQIATDEKTSAQVDWQITKG